MALSNSKTRLAADLALVGVGLFWGSSFAVIKDALNETTPANLLFMRFFLAWLVLLPLAWVKRGQFGTPMLKSGLICGSFLFLAFMTQAQGLAFTTASKSGFITGLNVVLVPLLTVLVLRKSPSPAAMLGAVVAFCGLFFLSNSGGEMGSFNVGDALTLACAFFCAGHIISLGRFAPGRDSFCLAFMQFSVVALGGLIWAMATGELNFNLSGPALWATIYLGLTCTILGFWGQTWAQAYTSPTRTAIIFTLEPGFGALFSYLWLGEELGLTGVLGGLLIITGIILAEVKPKAWSVAKTKA
ncbi:DMT family transporter [Dethiosulfatarculus sandiegensis]|uniref:DMT family permease n=1 Tax=Dethiosulfatarculus sandiegensis TaxID=1429043 RepID=A0A0D2J7K8_9BACT|nr:DMT family transporter [Dethiosulfatarculus sandiegensis]KIX11716.1 DMT family permease [Dethiosulfatarculus sandiegensis]